MTLISNLQLKWFESAPNRAASGTSSYSSSRLFCYKNIDAILAETAYAFCTRIAIFQNSDTSTSSAIYLYRMLIRWR